jgi:hypothetical protein
MFTIRNLGGVALLAMGSTWLWLTPAFAGRGVSTSGVLWSVTRALSIITVAAFCVATWGLFARHSWWEAVAMGAAVLGALALAPFYIAAVRGGESAGTVSWNALVHLLMLAGLVLLLEIPWLEQWVDHHVMSGR